MDQENQAVAEILPVKIGEKVWVPEIKQHIEVTPQWVGGAELAVRKLAHNWIENALTFLEIERNGYYHLSGCRSMNEFIETKLDRVYGRRHVYTHLKVAKTLEAELRNRITGNGDVKQLGGPDGNGPANYDIIGENTSITRLAALAELPQKTLDELRENGQVFVEEEGVWYSVEDTKRMNAKKLSELNTKIKTLEARAETAEAETEDYRKDYQQLKESIDKGTAEIIGDLTLKKQQLEEEIKALRNKEGVENTTAAEFAEMRRTLHNIWDRLRNYLPKDEQELETKDVALTATAAGICMDFGAKLGDLGRYYSNLQVAVHPE